MCRTIAGGSPDEARTPEWADYQIEGCLAQRIHSVGTAVEAKGFDLGREVYLLKRGCRDRKSLCRRKSAERKDSTTGREAEDQVQRGLGHRDRALQHDQYLWRISSLLQGWYELQHSPDGLLRMRPCVWPDGVHDLADA